jgi:farnesyl-diphosphate farnesyltransferase
MAERLDREVLKRVSRSFYLSLRLLPVPMRPALSLGYLLARASDTLADTAGIPTSERIHLLDGFRQEMQGGSADWRQPSQLAPFLSRQQHAGERELLQRLEECFGWLHQLPHDQREATRRVLATITAGQALDLQRFQNADAAHPVSLAGHAELEDYCYRVAGCVGEYWTEIGWLSMGTDYSHASVEWLLDHGIRYGKGLQLVNILRDISGDLKQGRCYLPVEDSSDASRIQELRQEWLGTAREWLASGKAYASALRSRRLRCATVLPVLIGEPTLDQLARATYSPQEEKIKVSRTQVRRALWHAFWWPTTGQ